MFFASDNGGPVHTEIMDALAQANQGNALPYGNDEITAAAVAKVREVFEAPHAAVYFVPTGTAANALALATLAKPCDTVFCAHKAHVLVDECNAPEFYMGSGKLTPVGTGDKILTDDLIDVVEEALGRGVHGAQPGPLSITQVTEHGQVYSLAEIDALVQVARQYNLPVHLDGARFANALVALGTTAADMTWRRGIDAVSFGGTKNGCLGVEAVVFFDPQLAETFELRRKRGGHLLSKQRFLSAQMTAYLTDDLWLRSARQANDTCARLAQGLRARDVPMPYEPQANLIFFRQPRAVHQKLHAAGATYYVEDGPLEGDPDEILLGRLVCDWSVTFDDIDRFLNLFGN
jgi:threonine aldolase